MPYASGNFLCGIASRHEKTPNPGIVWPFARQCQTKSICLMMTAPEGQASCRRMVMTARKRFPVIRKSILAATYFSPGGMGPVYAPFPKPPR
jgi:hypothetical protein